MSETAVPPGLLGDPPACLAQAFGYAYSSCRSLRRAEQRMALNHGGQGCGRRCLVVRQCNGRHHVRHRHSRVPNPLAGRAARPLVHLSVPPGRHTSPGRQPLPAPTVSALLDRHGDYGGTPITVTLAVACLPPPPRGGRPDHAFTGTGRSGAGLQTSAILATSLPAPARLRRPSCPGTSVHNPPAPPLLATHLAERVPVAPLPAVAPLVADRRLKRRLKGPRSGWVV